MYMGISQIKGGTPFNYKYRICYCIYLFPEVLLFTDNREADGSVSKSSLFCADRCILNF